MGYEVEPLAGPLDLDGMDPCWQRGLALRAGRLVGVTAEACDRLRSDPVPRGRVPDAVGWLARLLRYDIDVRAADLG